jgi:phage/plasmid-associated DNA primase
MATPPPINLALTVQPSFIADKKFIEIVSQYELEQLIDSDCIKTNWDLTNYSQKVAAQNYINAREQLKAYAATYSKKYGGCMVKYSKPRLHKYGRVFPQRSLGLTSLGKQTRNTLIQHSYYDFDLANAQPEIVRNICKTNSIPCDIIEKYCNEREDIIAEIITASGGNASRSDVKSLMIRLSFFGCFEGWLKEHSITEFPEPLIVKNYKKQISAIAQSLISKNPEMFETMKRIKKDKGELNVIGAFFSTYLQEYELRIVENVLVNLCEKTSLCSLEGLPPNVFVATYEFDGIKLFKPNVDEFGGTAKLLDALNALLQTAGWDMRFELKPMTHVYNIVFNPPPPIVDLKLLKAEEKTKDKIQRAIEKTKEKIEKELEREQAKERKKEESNEKFREKREDLIKDKTNLLAQTDLEASDIIYSQLKERLVYARDILYYKKQYYWIDKIENIKASLRYYINNSGINRLNEYNQIIPFVQNKKSTDAVTSLLIDKIMDERVNDEWTNDMFKSSLGKILFKNGYYDFHKGRFFTFKNKDYDHSIIFIKHIDYDFVIPHEVPPRSKGASEAAPVLFADYVADVKRRLFIDPFGEAMADYYILNLARGLAGDAMKRILFGIGDADTGKSTITTALDKTCGSYFGTFNGNNLAMKKFANPDDAQALRWLMLLAGCRIIASNEIAPDAIINGEILKKMVSGGRDKVVARGHGGYETEFNISFLPIVYANDLDKIQPFDDAIKTRVRTIPYEKVYKDIPSNEFELEKDKGLDAEILTFNFRYAFLTLLMESYKTFVIDKDDLEESIKDLQEEAMEATFTEDESFIKKFKSEFEITNGCSDFTSNIVIEDWLKRKLKGVSISKLSRDLKKFATLNKLEHVKKDKKFSGKVQRRGWFGIKKLTEDELKEE